MRPAGPPAPAPLLVGQAPSASAQGVLGASGARLAKLAGLGLEEYAARFARANLLDAWPGPAGRLGGGDAFDLADARAAWRDLLPHVHGRPVVLLGRHVARAAGLADAPWWEWAALSWRPRRRGWLRAQVAVVPHPSGVSRWWNDPDGVLRAAAWWSRLAATGAAWEGAA